MCDLRHSIINKVLLLALVGSGGFLFGTRNVPAQSMEGMEVLTRGPIHEAFAEPIAWDSGAGLVVQKLPPAAIEEIPAEEMPEGDSFVWIPGYWGWDEQRNDFLWISGIWRDPPPDCNWIPGYWTPAEGGAQWVAGFWLPNEVEESYYLPAPPASLEEGPQSDPPSQDDVWVPGSWVWPEDRYVWQPGYWVEARPDWVYTPTHYKWTPRGYVCVTGYWDYPIANRGVLFAPVYFSQPVYERPDFRYSPDVLIEVGGLTDNLFRYPRYNHYVFGDYYGDESTQLGIVPWFQLNVGHNDYDPIYAHQQREHGRQDSNWSKKMQADYQLRKEKVDARPPRVFDHPNASTLSHPDGRADNFVHAKTLQEVANEKNPSLRLKKIAQDERDNRGKTAKDLRKFTEERLKREAAQAQQAEAALPKDQAVKVEKLAIPKSPIKSAQRPGKNDVKAPPALPQLPKPDPNAKAGARKGEGRNPETPKNKVLQDNGVRHTQLPVMKPKPNEAVPNSIQDAQNPKAKGKRGPQLQTSPAPPPVTDSPPVETQDPKSKHKNKGNNKGKN